MWNAINVDDELLNLIDWVVLLDQEIKKIKAEKLDALEQKRDLMVKKIERSMTEWNLKELEWTLWKALRVVQNRKKVDDIAIFAKYWVSEEDVLKNTKITPVTFIKVTAKK